MKGQGNAFGLPFFLFDLATHLEEGRQVNNRESSPCSGTTTADVAVALINLIDRIVAVNRTWWRFVFGMAVLAAVTVAVCGCSAYRCPACTRAAYRSPP